MKTLIKIFVVLMLLLISTASYLKNAKYKDVGLYYVSSSSMEPEIHENYAVITRSSEGYEINDIITFKNPVDLSKTITHRIVGKSFDNGKYYVSRGDANTANDPWQIYPDIIEGRVIFKIPFIGYIVGLVQKPAGLVIGMIIPAGLLVFWETEVLYREIKRIKDNIYKRSMRRRLFVRRLKLRLANWRMRILSMRNAESTRDDNSEGAGRWLYKSKKTAL